MTTPLTGSWSALAQLHLEAQAAAWEAWLPPLLDGYFATTAASRRAVDMTLQSLATAAARWAADPGRQPRPARGTRGLAGVMAMMEVSKSGRDGVSASVRDELTLSIHRAFISIRSMSRTRGLLEPLAVPIGVAAMREGAIRALPEYAPEGVLRATLDIWLDELMPPGVPWRIEPTR